MTTRHTRASKTPLLLECAQSGFAPAVEIDDAGMPATVGTVVHKAFTDYVSTGTLPAFHDDECRLLFNCARRMWDDDVSQYFPEPTVEQDITFEIGPHIIGAHADIVSLIDVGDRKIPGYDVRVADLKTGRVESDANPQTRTYALAIASYFVPVKSVTVVTMRCRSMEWESETFDGAVLAEHRRRIEAALGEDSPPYRPGDHCQYCPRRHECPARLVLVRDALVLAKAQADHNLREFTPEGVQAVAAGVKMLAAMAKQLDGWLRTEIKAGGPLPLPDGETLDLVPQDRRAATEAAAPFVRQRFGVEALEGIAKLSIGDIEKLATDAADRSVRGSVGAAKKQIALDLRAAGAVKTQTSLQLKRVKAQIEERDHE